MTQFPAIIDPASLNGTNGFRIGDPPGDLGVLKVSSAGDVNGDGLADLIISESHSFPALDDSVSYVIFGQATGFAANLDLSSLDGSNGFRINGDLGVDGSSVSSAGDVNGDGLADLIIGTAYASPHGYLSGASYVVFGKASGFGAAVDLLSLDGTAGFKISGAASYDRTGLSVSSAGDVNGDGFADVIVGASGDAGASYVVFGKASGFAPNIDLANLDGSDGFKISGVSAAGYSRFSVASAGDVNGDGFSDLLIGAGGASPHGSQSGASFVIFGKESGYSPDFDLSNLNGTNGFKLSGVAAQDYSGLSVASAGDVNGDGYSDIIVGALNASPHGAGSGASYVVFGAASGFPANIDLSSLNGTNGFKISGAAAEDASGASVSSAGDVNGDGFADLIIGAFGAHPNGPTAGESYVVFGKAGGFAPNIDLSSLDGTNGFKIVSPAYGENGFSVSSAGDVNGDGLSDLIIAAPGTHPIGQTYVIFGQLPDDAVNRVGTIASQNLVGGDFNDTLSGLGGNDHLFGHGGDDTLNGGTGNDTLDGGPGQDTATYKDAAAGVHVSLLLTGPQDTGGAGTDSLIAIENLTGSNFNDTLTGGPGANMINGGLGDDSIAGRTGDDVLNGNPGNDTLGGGQGDDTLNGGLGNDQLTGGQGDDMMSGGPGSDTFIFAPGFGHDVITDFTPAGTGHDLISFSSEVFSDYAMVRSHMVQDGSNVVIAVNGDDDITLKQVHIADLGAADFIFF